MRIFPSGLVSVFRAVRKGLYGVISAADVAHDYRRDAGHEYPGQPLAAGEAFDGLEETLEHPFATHQGLVGVSCRIRR